jgi:hypothetical protein
VSHFSTPDTVVEIGFDLSDVGGPFFTFGSTDVPEDNPQSIFDNETYRFGGTLFYDVTDRVTSVSINRGLSRELDRFVTGGAQIEFTNQDRAFDPFYTASPFYPDIKPRRTVKLSSVVAGSTAVQFTGLVEDWNVDYSVKGDATASASCTDGFILFGGQQLSAHTATSQTTGARIGAVLDRAEVNWPTALRDIDSGAQTLQADVVEQGREVLEYLQLVAASEPGLLFMSKDNDVTFRDRNTAAAIGTIVLSDAGTAIPYTDVSISFGTELLFNRVTVAPLGIAPQDAESLNSQNEYGVQSLDLSGLLIQSGAAGTADAQALADYLVSKYAEPELRFEALTVQLAGLGTAMQADVLGIELTDIIRVEYQPNGIGDRIVKDVQVIGIRHAVQPDRHAVTFTLASTDTAAFVFGGGTSVADYPFSLFAGGSVDGSPFGL